MWLLGDVARPLRQQPLPFRPHCRSHLPVPPPFAYSPSSPPFSFPPLPPPLTYPPPPPFALLSLLLSVDHVDESTRTEKYVVQCMFITSRKNVPVHVCWQRPPFRKRSPQSCTFHFLVLLMQLTMFLLQMPMFLLQLASITLPLPSFPTSPFSSSFLPLGPFTTAPALSRRCRHRSPPPSWH